MSIRIRPAAAALLALAPLLLCAQASARERVRLAESCVIKGNVNARGERIYHTPESPWYDRTIVDERAGERWFCDEQEARDAGWRAPRR